MHLHNIDDIHDFGAAAYLSNRLSSLEQGNAGSPVESSPKLVGHICRDRPSSQNS